MPGLKMKGLDKFMSVLICIVFISCIGGCAREQQERHFYFVQITDTHFETGDNIDRSKKAVELINDLPMNIQCVVHTGDITTNRFDDKQLLDVSLPILGKIAAPIHFVAGNHDIFPERLESSCKAYEEIFGGLISQAEYEDVVFIFVFTEPLRKSFTIDGYQPLEQLEEYLKKADGKPVIVFHHAPSVDNFYNNEFHGGWENEIREKWVNLINGYNVKAVIAGHYHRDEHHWLGDVPLYVSAPISGYWGRQATFRIYEYHNGRIGYRTQYIE